MRKIQYTFLVQTTEVKKYFSDVQHYRAGPVGLARLPEEEQMSKMGLVKAFTVSAVFVTTLLLLAPSQANAWGGQCRGSCVECCNCVDWYKEWMCCCSAGYDGYCSCEEYYSPKKEWCLTGGMCQGSWGRY